MPCFENIDVNTVISKFSERFKCNLSENDLEIYVEDIIKQSYNNFWTNKYDYFQQITNGILP
jgi:phosphatidylinositol kinase/protein kinase (PI-3  family)